jgi:hypothetical protein
MHTCFPRQRGKTALRELDPRDTGGLDVQLKAWPPAGQAADERRFVPGAVLEDEIGVEMPNIADESDGIGN